MICHDTTRGVGSFLRAIKKKWVGCQHMGLGESSIRSWESMKYIFLKKYLDYCKTKESHNDIFKVQQLEYETLEDYMERFGYISKKSKYHDLLEDAIRALFLKGIFKRIFRYA
jgi:hypothetical protein